GGQPCDLAGDRAVDLVEAVAGFCEALFRPGQCGLGLPAASPGAEAGEETLPRELLECGLSMGERVLGVVYGEQCLVPAGRAVLDLGVDLVDASPALDGFGESLPLPVRLRGPAVGLGESLRGGSGRADGAVVAVVECGGEFGGVDPVPCGLVGVEVETGDDLQRFPVFRDWLVGLG